MATVDLSQEMQKRSKSRKFWSSRTFAELMAYSKLEAAMYAVDCWVDTKIMWMPVKEFIANSQKAIAAGNTPKKKESKKVVKNSDPEEDEEEEVDWDEESDTTDPVISECDLKEALTSKWIAFHHKAGMKKLMELAKTSGLL